MHAYDIRLDRNERVHFLCFPSFCLFYHPLISCSIFIHFQTLSPIHFILMIRSVEKGWDMDLGSFRFYWDEGNDLIRFIFRVRHKTHKIFSYIDSGSYASRFFFFLLTNDLLYFLTLIRARDSMGISKFHSQEDDQGASETLFCHTVTIMIRKPKYLLLLYVYTNTKPCHRHFHISTLPWSNNAEIHGINCLKTQKTMLRACYPRTVLSPRKSVTPP